MNGDGKKRIVFLTGTRADFGKMKPLIFATVNTGRFDVLVFATGMHMSEKHGYTFDEIRKCDFPHTYAFINDAEHGTMDTILAHTIEGFGNYVKLYKPDMVVVHGDRVEALAGAIVGSLNNILVAHVEGGEVSGTVDETLRHSISKMAHLHFVANEEARKRLIQLGEEERNIYLIGSPDIDIMASPDLPAIEESIARYDIPFNEYAILLFHPVTTEMEDIIHHTNGLVDAVAASGFNYIIIQPNNDPGNDIILEVYKKRLHDRAKYRMFPSIRFEHFLTFLKHAHFIVGNSSAGIREAPFFGVPAINFGTRQTRRLENTKNENIHHVYNDHDMLRTLIDKFTNQKTRFTPKYHFGEGKSTEKFLTIIQEPRFWQTKIQKNFLDINFTL